MSAASQSESSEYRYPRPGMIDAQPSMEDRQFAEVLRIARAEAMRHWDDADVAEDLAQRVAIRMWRAGAVPSDLLLYISRAVRRQALDQRRGLEREDDMLERYTAYRAVHEPTATYGADEHTAITWQDRYTEWLATLPPKRRRCFRMVREEGMTYPQVASVLGITLKTVERHLNNANQQAREFFEREQPRRSA